MNDLISKAQLTGESLLISKEIMTYMLTSWCRDPLVAKKDLNIINSGFRIHLTPDVAKSFLERIQLDCQFFEQHSIIDYSLLLGVHYIGKSLTKDPGEGREEEKMEEILSRGNLDSPPRRPEVTESR